MRKHCQGRGATRFAACALMLPLNIGNSSYRLHSHISDIMVSCLQVRSLLWMVEEMETYLYFNDGDELHDGKFDGLKDEREVKSFRPMDQPICQRGSIQKIL